MKNQTKLMAIAIAIVILMLPLAVFKIFNQQSSELSIPSASEPIRVACVGDSITAVSGYPSDLQSMLGNNYTVGNFGCKWINGFA